LGHGSTEVLLVPELTEIQWTIRPSLQKWAEVVSYDPPGVGAERGAFTRDAIADRGLEEVRDRGWERFFVVADGWAMAPAVRIASQARDQVQGLALGHARLSDRLDGPRAPTNRAVYEGMTELIRRAALAFIRHGIVQATGGSVDEALAEEMVERFPAEVIQSGWEELTRPEDFGDELRALGIPMLLGKHDGCLMLTEEGYEDAVAAFPGARTVVSSDACCVAPEFAESLRDFCTGSG
jgi:hypothetical protein